MTSRPVEPPTIDELRRHIAAAETPALLMLTAHVTDDPGILREEWRPDPVALPRGSASAADDASIRELCLRLLEPHLAGMADWPERPSALVMSAIGEWVLGESAGEVQGLLHQAFVPAGTDPRAPQWTVDQVAPGRNFRVAIVGAGISGLLAGLRMKQAGVEFVILEKDDSVGGTWTENTYPDCRTDVHSHVYSYSFLDYEWPSYFSRQHVILDSLRQFASDQGLLDHIRFGVEVTGASWNDDLATWTVSTVDRDRAEESRDYNVLVSAVGQLNRPSVPDIDGLDRFAGPAFHSAEWDHSVDFAGKRVAVIGTGASALQFGPAVAREAASVTVFQRSAPWLKPTPELREDIPDHEAWLFSHVPAYRAYYRFSIFLPRAIGQLEAVTVDPEYPPTERAVSAVNEQMRKLLTAYLEDQVTDRPDLAEQIIPDYPPGSKRIIRDDGTWIATLKRDNVRLVSDAVAAVDETGVITRGGEHIDADVICFGTGFKASDFLMPMKVTGAGGVDLHETWGIDACAYMGMTLPDFPNLFCLYGPNTNLVVHGNLVFFMECQSVYLLSAVKTLLEGGHRSMNLRPEVFEDYRDEITEASAQRAWGWSKTHSWYQNAEGRSTIMWPLSAQRYLDSTEAVDPDHYEFS
ncbi:flavin-containing monooxygenase [Flexivirga alba]|uniref:Flavin-containing monooxygenase n=1 Tax=Flexivirga alba TaxID=702742 RepID=A0ABW2AJV9_9MICO